MKERNFIIILADIYLMGFIFHLIPFTRQFMPVLTPLVLLLSSASVLFMIRGELNCKTLIWIAATYLATFIFEAAGTATGKIFGEYSYGQALGLKIFDVPLVIGFNWVMIIFGLYTGLSSFSIKAAAVPFLTAGLAVVFDFVMEPAAVALDYWSWNNGVIPLQNYIAWFLIALLSASLMTIFRIEMKSRLPFILVVTEFVFFIFIRIFYPGV